MTENDLEQACIDWFRELGWEYAHGESISPGGFSPERAHYNEVVLAPRFRAALETLNPDLPATAIDDAEKRVRQFAGQSLVEANRDLYVWLRDGIPVDIEEDGHRRQAFHPQRYRRAREPAAPASRPAIPVCAKIARSYAELRQMRDICAIALLASGIMSRKGFGVPNLNMIVYANECRVLA